MSHWESWVWVLGVPGSLLDVLQGMSFAWHFNLTAVANLWLKQENHELEWCLCHPEDIRHYVKIEECTFIKYSY